MVNPRTSSHWAASLPKCLQYAAGDHWKTFGSIEKPRMKAMNNPPFESISMECLDG